MSGSAAQIYDFETAIETAVKRILEDAGLNCYATQDAAALERLRPRVEIQFTVGPATDHLQQVGEQMVHDAFTGSLILSAVTDMIDGIDSHTSYRSGLRAIGAQLIYDLDDDALPFHDINQVMPAGSTPVVSPSDGLFESRQVYTVHFNIKQSAW